MVDINAKSDYKAFQQRLGKETELLQQWFTNHHFSEEKSEIGSELEFFLVDSQCDPAPHNLQFISEVNENYLIPEVGASQLEINSSHYPLTKNCFSSLHENLLGSIKKCQLIAQKNNYYLALIGSLPTATPEHQGKKYMTQKSRYALIDKSIEQYSAGKPPIKTVNGFEPLLLDQPQCVSINGILSAFQLHLQVPFSQSVRYYNIIQLLSGPILSLACNSPFVLGQFVSHESRISVFDEVVTLYNHRDKKLKCCFFGNTYLKDSFYELFKQNKRYPNLLPEISQDTSLEEMLHVRRQNGVIYRWNRPVIDFNEQEEPHLRIEFRSPPSGPTIVDMMANAVFYYGLVNYYSESPLCIDTFMTFNKVRQNFYNAAKYGLNCHLYWGKTQIKATDLLLELVSKARLSLKSLQIPSHDIKYYLDIIENRLKKKVTGSSWQLDFIDKYGKDFNAMMAAYLENQYKELPVSEWKSR